MYGVSSRQKHNGSSKLLETMEVVPGSPHWTMKWLVNVLEVWLETYGTAGRKDEGIKIIRISGVRFLNLRFPRVFSERARGIWGRILFAWVRRKFDIIYYARDGVIAVGNVGQICIFLQGPLAVRHLMRDNSNLNHSKYVKILSANTLQRGQQRLTRWVEC